MRLEGSLETFPLRELIDMAVYSSITGAINIYTQGEQGRLYFRDGTLYHATRGPSQGIEALAELLEPTSGTFAVIADLTSEEESLCGALSHHLQTAERTASRWRMVRSYVPNLDLIPGLLVSHEAALRRVGPAYQPVLNAVDGKTSLRQIASALGWATIDVAEAIVQMTVDGLVELRAQRASTPSPPPPEEPGAPRGLFDRLRTRNPPPQCQAPDPLIYSDTRSPEDLILKLLRS